MSIGFWKAVILMGSASCDLKHALSRSVELLLVVPRMFTNVHSRQEKALVDIFYSNLRFSI